MFLTLQLCKPFKFPKGNIWRGKYRLVRKVTNLDIAQVRNELDTERKNMFYLRNPFLLAKEIECLPQSQRTPDKTCVEKNRDKTFSKFLRRQESRKIGVFLNQTLGSAEKWE